MNHPPILRAALLAALVATGCQATATGNVAVTPSAAPSATTAPTAAPTTSAAPSAAASPSARVMGESKPVFGANATLYAVPAGTGYEELGFELPHASVDAASTADTTKPAIITTLRFSEEVRKATFVDHLDIDYNPHGHDPAGIYGVPHYDFHFYGITPEEKLAIDCKDETAVAPVRLPEGYALLPPPKGQCVPQMGIHASELSSPELAPSSPAPFTKTMILGFYAGKQHFIEPMATREYLLKKESFSLKVGRSAELGRTTLYPSSFVANFDEARNTWVFALRGWSMTSK